MANPPGLRIYIYAHRCISQFPRQKAVQPIRPRRISIKPVYPSIAGSRFVHRQRSLTKVFWFRFVWIVEILQPGKINFGMLGSIEVQE